MVLENFTTHLEKYAQLITAVGVEVKKGQTIVLNIAVDQAPLARLITKSAYAAGAAEVIVQWNDDVVQKEFLKNAASDRLENVAPHKVTQMNEWLAKKVSRISVVSSDPDALKGVDSARIATFQSATGKALLPLRKATQNNEISWTVVAAAGPDWAKKVFPDLPQSEQVDALWDAIFKAVRIYSPDPIAAWREHDHKLASKAAELNAEQFDALHYTAPGTDLTVGLPKGHLWYGAGATNASGETFMANMPTEEVFSAPDFRRVNGVVSSTKPLSYAGTTILGMSFTFVDGKITDFSAEQGQEVLATLIDTDEGSHYLGEVALVPDPSPISQSGITFFNTLFDENASNHLAIGAAYPFNLDGGTKMTEENLQAAGLNRSQTHVDFMIGSAKMNIDGLHADGRTTPIFRNGDWA